MMMGGLATSVLYKAFLLEIAMNLVIAGTQVGQDAQGRYCINDLHRAAGGEEKHSPNRWTRIEGYKALVAALTPDLAFAPEEAVRGGANPGTYVCKELVYAYAMWISPEFSIKVIRAYDAMITSQPEPVDPAVFPAVAFKANTMAGMAYGDALNLTRELYGLDRLPAALAPVPIVVADQPRPAGKPIIIDLEPSRYYTVASLAAARRISSGGMNGMLSKKGLQGTGENGHYVAMGEGKKYSRTSGRSLLWRGDVLDILYRN